MPDEPKPPTKPTTEQASAPPSADAIAEETANAGTPVPGNPAQGRAGAGSASAGPQKPLTVDEMIDILDQADDPALIEDFYKAAEKQLSADAARVQRPGRAIGRKVRVRWPDGAQAAREEEAQE